MHEELTAEELEYETEETGPAEEPVEEQVEAAEEAPAEEPVDEAVPRSRYDEIHRAMDSERARRKEAEARIAEMQQQLARLDERTRILGGEEIEPEVEVDPLERVQEETRTLREELAQQKMVAELNHMESSYSQENPDYREARDMYFDRVKAQLTARGYDEGEIRQRIAEEVRDIVDRARSAGANPAAKIFEMAQAIGFASSAKGATEKVERISRASKPTASNVSGSVPRGELTPETAADLTEAEIANLTPDQERAMWGG